MIQFIDKKYISPYNRIDNLIKLFYINIFFYNFLDFLVKMIEVSFLER